MACGPGCCTCDWQVKRVYLWLCVAAVVSCVVAVVPMSSPVWTEGGYGEDECLETGLLVFCHRRNSSTDRRCAPLLLGTQNAWCEAVRLMAILSWVFLFTVFVLSSLLHVHDDQCAFSFHLIVLGSFAGVLGLVSAVVYTVPWTDPESVLRQYDAHLSWGYALYILTHVLVLTLFITIGVRSRHLWDSQFRVQRALKDKRHRAVVSPAYYG